MKIEIVPKKKKKKRKGKEGKKRQDPRKRN